MFIPIVRRTITVRIRETFRFPYRCDVCSLITAASVYAEGMGQATMAYLAPDENIARNAARTNAYSTACQSFAQCPCPRCGSHSTMSRNALRAWELRVVSRKQVRFWLTIVGLALTFLMAGGCGVWVVASEGIENGGLGAAIVMAIIWIGLGAAGTGIAYAIAGPGARPILSPYIPQNVAFDPPDPSQQIQAGYRAG